MTKKLTVNYFKKFIMTLKKQFWFFTLIFITSCASKDKIDIVDKQNDKVGILFEQAIEKEKLRIENKFYAGLMPSCTKRIDEYFKSIRIIESYASKGTSSKDKFNKLQVRIIFNDGKVAEELYTGVRVVQAYGMGAQLLVKMELINGAVVKTYTNGAELNNAPQSFVPDIENIKNAVLSYDREINKNAYYYPAKTQEDIQKEWDDLK
jgi:hypothetical protein